jgi:hypothetical protein
MSDEEETVSVPQKNAKRNVWNNAKEEEPGDKRTQPKEKEKKSRSGKTCAKAISVEALFSMGSKTSVTAKTMAAMTSQQNSDIMDTAGKALLIQARKGLRDETMKVVYSCCTFLSFSNCEWSFTLLPIRQNTAKWPRQRKA